MLLLLPAVEVLLVEQSKKKRKKRNPYLSYLHITSFLILNTTDTLGITRMELHGFSREGYSFTAVSAESGGEVGGVGPWKNN